MAGLGGGKLIVGYRWAIVGRHDYGDDDGPYNGAGRVKHLFYYCMTALNIDLMVGFVQQQQKQ